MTTSSIFMHMQSTAPQSYPSILASKINNQWGRYKLLPLGEVKLDPRQKRGVRAWYAKPR